MIDALKKIICIDEVTILKVSETEVSIHSTIADLRNANVVSLTPDLKKLKELCDFSKMTDLNKVVNKLPTLAPTLKKFSNNYATLAQADASDIVQGINSIVYVFHFEFKSMRTILEK